MNDDLPRDRAAATEDLFRRHAVGLVQVAALLVGNEVAAQDVVLQAFVDVHVRRRSRDSFEALGALRAAVLRRSRDQELESVPVLAPLTRRQREVVVLRWWLGLSAQETGELLRMSSRSVTRTFGEARAALPPDDDLAESLTTRAAAAELSYDALYELRHRISAAQSRHRRRVGAGVAAAVLLLGGVGGILWTTRPRPYSSPTGRPVFAAVVPVAEFATFDLATGRLRGNVNLRLAEAVASLPRDGWLVSRLDSGCRSILMAIDSDGSARQIGGPLDGQLADLAVSSDGRYGAGVSSLCGSTPLVRLDVVDLRTGRLVGEWNPPTGTTSISGLSWAPDNRRLAYTLGSGVGGRGSGYALLDTRASGGRLAATDPSARQVDLPGRTCPVVRSLWLGRTGRFAVFAACLDGNELLVVRLPADPRKVQREDVIATLPGSALTLGLDAAATGDGRHLLVTTDVATYRIDGSRVTRLADLRPSPAW